MTVDGPHHFRFLLVLWRRDNEPFVALEALPKDAALDSRRRSQETYAVSLRIEADGVPHRLLNHIENGDADRFLNLGDKVMCQIAWHDEEVRPGLFQCLCGSDHLRQRIFKARAGRLMSAAPNGP